MARFRALAVALVWIAALGNCDTHASEYGISTYRVGLMDLFAGYMAPPGATIVKNYMLFQDASQDAVTANGQIHANTHTVNYTEALFAAHVTNWKILGSYWAVGAVLQSRMSDQTLNVGPAGHLQRLTDTVGGFGDLIVSPWMMSWTFGRFHLMNSLMFYAPTGSYDPDQIINIGLNRWSIEPDVGITWMDEETGRHASAFIGYTINTENTATHYRSGDEFHADFVVAQHLRNGIALGMAGYAFQQTTGDSGGGDAVGSYKGRVFALGPLTGITVKFLRLHISFTVKYEVEFGAQNRSTGNELWLTAALPL